MTNTDIDQAKQAMREQVWTLLDQGNVVQPPGAHGHIPSFVGAAEAAVRLAELSVWQAARVIKANPDRAQLPVRVAALTAGKIVYMAVPGLANIQPFYLLDPAHLSVSAAEAASSHTAARVAKTVNVSEMQPVDIVVCGSVAVNRQGARLGKGAGYSDIEVALLAEAGLVGPQTIIITTVHDLQVVGEELPETEHDFSVDIIVTPEEIITCGPPRRPRGLYWEHLSAEKIAGIPVLTARVSGA